MEIAKAEQAVALLRWSATPSPEKQEVILEIEGMRIASSGNLQKLVMSFAIPAGRCERLADDIRAAVRTASQS